MIKISSRKILQKIHDADLNGRGGAGYPTGIKWQRMFDKKPEKMFMVVNGW